MTEHDILYALLRGQEDSAQQMGQLLASTASLQTEVRMHEQRDNDRFTVLTKALEQLGARITDVEDAGDTQRQEAVTDATSKLKAIEDNRSKWTHSITMACLGATFGAVVTIVVKLIMG